MNRDTMLELWSTFGNKSEDLSNLEDKEIARKLLRLYANEFSKGRRILSFEQEAMLTDIALSRG